MHGYRPPHQGRQQINKLREAYEKHQEELLDKEVARYRKAIEPVHINHGIPAVRAWNISENGFLKSLAAKYEWSSTIAREDVPVTLRGARGYWAVKPSGLPILFRYRPQVYGLVELSGTVVEHTYGWRAEVCAIQHLYVYTPNLHLPTHVISLSLQGLGDIYQCDVTTFRHLTYFEQVVSQFTGRRRYEHR